MKPPIQIAKRLARSFAARYAAIAPRIVEACIRGWERNGVVGHQPLRFDASSHVNRALREVLHIVAEPVDTRAIDAAGAAVDRKNAATQRLAGVPTSNVATGAEIDRFRDNNLALIKSLDQDMIDRLREKLQLAEIEAWRVEQLRNALVEELDITKRHAELIARDQTLKLYGNLTQARQTGAGIDRYEWSTSADERVRPDHDDLDGTIQSWMNPPVTNQKTGARNHPGTDIQCRCVAVPILDDDA